MKEYLAMWRNYVNFTDRTNIRGYWMAVLFNVIACAIIWILIAISWRLMFLSWIYSLATIVPGLAMTVRRLRDAGKRWTWIFISLVPIAGAIVLIVMLCKPSVPDDGVPVV